MTKEFCDICGRFIETYKNVSEFKLKKADTRIHEDDNLVSEEKCKYFRGKTI